ncbi:ABC transporter ATP-binding protein [Estrella lausannensis]|uniref:Transport ATP binding protein n=1 Tax=Estrella lausannensis TaxID=483423 RepID=A0A0H5DQQ3_9BACT|nr:ABC transporter ATP-binding protein [Estrella lausannensis]CRX38433.1 transport ATP binding protein [Estrella lausannensis]
MKQLFFTAFSTARQRLLVAISVFFMIFLTISSQLEVVSLGIIARKGPDFFEIFSQSGGKKAPAEVVTKVQFEQRWQEIDSDGKGSITKEDVERYLKKENKGDIISKILSYLPLPDNLSSNILFLAGLISVVALFKAVTLFGYRYTTKLAAIETSRLLRERFFSHIQTLPMSFYQKHNIATLSNRAVGDAYVIAEATNSLITNYLQTPLTIVSTFILCFATSWQLSSFIFIGMPLIAVPIYLLTRKVKKVSYQILKRQELFSSILIDFISGIQTVKMFSMEDFSKRKYTEQNDALAELEKKSARYDLSTRPIVHTIGMLFLSATILMGLYVQEMSVPEILIFCGFLYLFYEPVKKFAEENSRIQRGVAAAERLFEIIQEKPVIEDSFGAKTLSEFKESIVFKDVWFKYRDTDWVLKGLNFEVKKGQMVAIVGPTGAGKSTIVQLLTRLYDVTQGSILIDGHPLGEYTQKSLRETISVVPQKPFLFIDTVESNIAVGRGHDIKDVVMSAKKAQADEFIARLPDGYQTMLSEAGKDLSGGQQQRITIARALLKNAPVIVMDEATSSLDMISEHKIKEALKTLRGTVTEIVIAHRLSTIEDADCIIYMDEGHVIAKGTKEELLQTCEPFRAMWNMMTKRQTEVAVQ